MEKSKSPTLVQRVWLPARVSAIVLKSPWNLPEGDLWEKKKQRGDADLNGEWL